MSDRILAMNDNRLFLSPFNLQSKVYVVIPKLFSIFFNKVSLCKLHTIIDSLLTF